MRFFKKLFGGGETRAFQKHVAPIVAAINGLEEQYREFSTDELREKTGQLKERLQKGETLDDILPDAFALVREAARRTLGQRHYDVQLIGGVALHEGKVAEMKTGEGKTLAATLPVYLNALAGEGVHVVTVNDYLARRDTAWMGQVYAALGLRVGCLNHDSAYLYDASYRNEEADEERDATGGFKVVHEFLRPASRREAYKADITYGTNNEFGFDYLRDNLVYSPEQAVQRSEWSFAIVDEVDSILIDEARTPLIISQPDEESGKLYEQFARIVPKLEAERDYVIDEKRRAVTLTEEGISTVEKFLGIDNIYEEGGVRLVHHLDQALKAYALFRRDRDYVVKNGEVIIVDQFTGRLMPGRRYSEGLHQAIEAKEGVKIQRESRTVATITFQNYFRLYKKLAGMTGTALTSSEEFFKVYGLEVVAIPTNKPLIRRDLPDRVYRTERGKFKEVAAEVSRIYKTGQPVLIGTISIEKNEYLGQLLTAHGIPHKVLNAKNHETEAEIIAQAGRVGAVTVATNMAGRGVDIILGGNPADADEAKKVRELGGLHVIGTERHEARRIDNQLRGRAGRQGDPGSSEFFVSLEDDLMRIFGGDRVKRLMERFNVPEDESLQSGIVSKAIESAQERIEGYHFDIRKHVLEYDEVINKQRETVYRMRRGFIEPTTADSRPAAVLDMVREELTALVLENTAETGEVDYNALRDHLRRIFPLDDESFSRMEASAKGKKGDELAAFFADQAEKLYRVKEAAVGEDTMRMLEKTVLVRTLDHLWMDHLEHMDYIRSSIGLRAYGQRDPIVEYTKESRIAFDQLLAAFRSEVAHVIYRVNAVRVPNEPQRRLELRGAAKTSGEPAASANPAPRRPGEAKIGRNDPCPCGAVDPATGKPYKYKKCGLINAPHHKG